MSDAGDPSSNGNDLRVLAALRAFVTLAPSIACVLGSAFVLEAALGTDWFGAFLPTWGRTAPNTALGLVCVALSLLVTRGQSKSGMAQRLSEMLSIPPIVIGLFTSLEYLAHLGPGFDEFLMRGVHGGGPDQPIGRASIAAAVSLVLLGTAVLVGPRRIGRVRIATILASFVLAQTFVVIVGHLFAVRSFAVASYLRPYPGMPLASASMTFAIGLAIVVRQALESSDPIMANRGPGGALARSLFPSALIIPTLLAGVVLKFVLVAGLEVRLAFALMAMVATGVAWLVVSRAARSTDRFYREIQLTVAAREVAEEARRRLAAIVEWSADAIVAVGVDGRITSWNRGAEEMFGYEAGEALGMPITELSPPELRESAVKLSHRIFEGEVIRNIEVVRMHKDGRRMDVAMTVFPIRDRERRVVAISGMLRDITEKKRAEAERICLLDAIEEERTWFKTVFVRSPLAMVLIDKRNGFRVEANRHAEELRGGSLPPDVDLEHLESLGVAPDGRPIPPSRSPVRRALAGEEVSGEEMLIHRADGREVPVLLSVSPVRGREDDVTGAVVTLVDITGQKELHRLREEWTSIIAHDLRQPVSAVTLAADLAEQSIDEGNAKSQRAHLQRIRTAAQRLARMTDDLLDVSRIEASEMRLERRDFDLVPLLRDAVDSGREADPRHTFAFHCGASDAEIHGDPDRIRQVVDNLISNASKYGRPDSVIRVDLERRDTEVAIVVSNKGPGIAPSDAKQLFGRFFRAHSARTGAKGVGLGLYICKGLVDAHGGRIWAESTPGDKTAFHVVLPMGARDGPGIQPRTAGDAIG